MDEVPLWLAQLYWQAWLTGVWLFLPAVGLAVLVFLVRRGIERFKDRST